MLSMFLCSQCAVVDKTGLTWKNREWKRLWG